MKISDLTTPSFLVDLDKLEQNLREMGELCRANGKMLWPMVKTHKSTAIAKMQEDFGAAGFMTGTVDEAEKLTARGCKHIMLAYPVAARENIARVIELAKMTHIILSLDGVEAAAQFESMLAGEGIEMDYLLIIDSGLHRFGVLPENALELMEELAKFPHLKFKGISTHPGQVYGKNSPAEVEATAADEVRALDEASDILRKAGYQVEIVATGSTPTAAFAARDANITTLRPGNYVFYDALQVALGVIPPHRCALTVLATVIANPREDFLIIDAGSKCFGLDKGAHGISLASGFGIVKDYPELAVDSLSEEVGKVKITGPTNIKVGDKIEVIPNHSCTSANMTDYLIGHRNGVVEKAIHIDMRGGSVRKPPAI
jgi:D-serine deaminase-like pyridoxal phosphate-dependent protein